MNLITLNFVMWNDSSFVLFGDSFITYITIIFAIVTTAMMSIVVITDNTEGTAVKDVKLVFFIMA